MRAVDTNVLVYAYLTDSPRHRPAAAMVKSLADSSSPWAIPWPCLHEFVSTVTNRRIVPGAPPMSAALDQVDVRLSSPSLRVISETALHAQTLRRVLLDSGITGAGVHDARIAAICLEHGVREIVTGDRGFLRFAQLTVIDPS